MKNQTPIEKWKIFNEEFSKQRGFTCFHNSSPNLDFSYKTNPTILKFLYQEIIAKNRFGYQNKELDKKLKNLIINKIIKNPLTKLNQIVFTHGAQQALFFIISLLSTKKKTLLLENYNYVGLSRLIAHFKYKTVLIPDVQTATKEQLAKIFKTNSNSLLYIQPDLTNPTGRSLSLFHRKQLIELTKKFKITIIEDLTYRPLIYSNSKLLPSLRDLDESVISIYSTSKAFFPSLRLGWIVANQNFIESLDEIVETNQLAISAISKSFFFAILQKASNFKKTVAKYQLNMETLTNELTTQIPSASFHKPLGGYYLWTKFPRKITLKEMHQAKIIVPPGNIFSYRNSQIPYYRMSFSQLSPEEIKKSITILAKLFN